MAGLVVLFLGSGPPALSAAVQAGPSAAASPCFAAAAGGHGPEPPYARQSLLPSDPSTAAPGVETKGKVCSFLIGLICKSLCGVCVCVDFAIAAQSTESDMKD